MIIIIVAICVILSIVVSTFISFSPNVHALVEKNFMRRVYSNLSYNCLQHGQLASRAKTLDVDHEKDIDLGYLRKKAGTSLDEIGCVVTMPAESVIEVDMEYERVKPKDVTEPDEE